ncbi:PqqD family protein [Bacillus nakamurai]|uniref:PqqD family protein n=1 Tax=Bacillus nakamurai TaxID=1793963 RepID=UPI001E41AA9F|nr:PqqD family protein [Bacillus nakamurai]MCC9022359.1 PqqD family protein [Bacillus nakamurai]
MIYQKNIFVRFRIIDSKSYLILNDNAFILDDIGVNIWESIDSKKTIEEIINNIANVYSVDVNKITKDIKNYLKDLEKNGLIEISKEL